jgi:hypothetical protein
MTRKYMTRRQHCGMREAELRSAPESGMRFCEPAPTLLAGHAPIAGGSGEAGNVKRLPHVIQSQSMSNWSL